MTQYTFLTEIKFLDVIKDAIKSRATKKAALKAEKQASEKFARNLVATGAVKGSSKKVTSNPSLIQGLADSGAITHSIPETTSTLKIRPLKTSTFKDKLHSVGDKIKKGKEWTGKKIDNGKKWVNKNIIGEEIPKEPIDIKNFNPALRDSSSELALGLGATGLGVYGAKTMVDDLA